MSFLPAGTVIRSAHVDPMKAHTGKTTGATHRCQMEGCTGVRVTVKWDNGGFLGSKITHPCSKGLLPLPDGSWQIGSIFSP